MKKKKKTKVLIAQPNPSNLNSPYFDLAKKHDLNIHFSPFLSIEGETVKNIRLQNLFPLSELGIQVPNIRKLITVL